MLCIKKLDTEKLTFGISTVHEANNGVLLQNEVPYCLSNNFYKYTSTLIWTAST